MESPPNRPLSLDLGPMTDSYKIKTVMVRLRLQLESGLRLWSPLNNYSRNDILKNIFLSKYYPLIVWVDIKYYPLCPAWYLLFFENSILI